MKGHIATKGEGRSGRYYAVASVGKHLAQRCLSCNRRSWVEGQRPWERCPKCEGAMSEPKAERRLHWSKGFTTEREAQRELRRILSQVDDHKYVAPSTQTLRSFLVEQWLPAIKPPIIKETTWASYESHVRVHIGRDPIAETTLTKLSPELIQAFEGRLLRKDRADGRQKLSPSTVRRVHATLHRALVQAVKWQKLQTNPADAVTLPQIDAAGEEMKTWTGAELRRFLDFIEADRLAGLWTVLAMTGMRRGEALGLRWGDIDFDNRRISVRRSVVSVDYEPHISTPKSGKSRVVDMGPTIERALRGHRRLQSAEKFALGSPSNYNPTDAVFCTTDGSIIHPQSVSRIFATLVAASGLPAIRLHDLRHTHATQLLQAGAHPKVVQERLGHASIGITLDTYSHVIPTMQPAAVDQHERMLFGAGA